MGFLDKFREKTPSSPASEADKRRSEPDANEIRKAALEGTDLEAQRALLTRFLVSRGVSDSLLPSIAKHTKNGIALFELGDATRQSRIGGPGLLGLGEPWPEGAKGKPLTFVARLCLDELPRLEPLPAGGDLAVYWAEDFHEWDKMDWRAATSVRYFPPGTPTVETSAPAGANHYAPISVTGALMPILGEIELVTPLDGTQGDELYEALDELAQVSSQHTLLGSSRDVQGPVLGEVSYWFDQMFDSSRVDYSDEERSGEDWVLLGQIDSTGDLMFGDAGCLYLVLPSADLLAGRFDRVLGIMQCA